MKIAQFQGIAPGNWNKVCENSDEAWLFHRTESIEIETSFFSQQNFSFGIVDDEGSLIGVQPLHLSTVGLGRWAEKLLNSGIHRHTGLAIKSGLSRKLTHSARELAISELLRIAEELAVDRIQLNCQNLAPINLSLKREEIPFWVAEHDFYLGLNYGPNGFIPAPGLATCCADQIVPLTKSNLDELFDNLDAPCRRAVRKAEKGGLSIHLDENAEAVDDYYSLAEISAQRTGETLRSKEYYAAIYSSFRHTQRCRILFAKHQDRFAGALLLLIDKGAVHFAAGVSHPEFLGMRVNDFMHWSAIKWAREQGCTHYRLGPVFPELPADWPIAKVSRFKRKFGGLNVPVIQGSLFLHPEKYQEAAVDHVAVLCRIRPIN